MRKLIIFGVGEQAELAWWFFTNDSDYEVDGFVVDREYLKGDVFHDLPVTAVEDVVENYPPSDYDAFVAIGYNKVNRLREEKYNLMKGLGYSLASYKSSNATILTNSIGDNCFLLEDNTIQPFVEIGNNVTLWSGNHIGHHTKVQDHCFITSHVVISGGVTIGHHSFLGVNATFRDHIKVGAFNVIGAAAIIMADTEDEAVYVPDRTRPKNISSLKLRGI